MAMSVAATECGVCNEEYDEEARCPRIFLCFHTFCTSCIDKLIKSNSKQCPFCRRNFMVNCSSDVMKNHTMMELMKYVSLQEPRLKPTQKYRGPPRKKRIENLKKETEETISLYLVDCQEAQKQIEKTLEEVTNLGKNIKDENTRIENDVPPKIQNVISQNNRMVGELDRTKNKLENQLKEVKDKDMQLKKMKGNLNSCTATTFSETAALLDEAEETNTATGYWMENFKGIISEEEKALHTKQKTIKRIKEKINITLDVLNSKEEAEEEIAPIAGMAAMAIQEDNLPTQIAPETLREMSAQVKHLVNQGRIYAIQHNVGRRRSARISYSEDEKLCLHHLREEPIIYNAHVVDHGEVMRLVDPSSRLIFLELGVGGATLGRLYIRLHPGTKGGKQFLLLSTGEKGPSYVNTNILWVREKGSTNEHVTMGDYECNDGEGGKALVQSVWEEKGREYERPWLAGSVEGIWGYASERREATAAQFDINTRDHPGVKLCCSLGIVEEGLSVLTEAISHYPNIEEVSIKDCGIVLPR